MKRFVAQSTIHFPLFSLPDERRSRRRVKEETLGSQDGFGHSPGVSH